MAVRATKLGAIDFLEKPISTEKLLLTVENALRLDASRERKPGTQKAAGRHQIVWASRAMRDVDGASGARGGERNARLHSRRNRNRKGTHARTLHEKSHRRDGPFISLNCAAIPSS